MAHIANEHVSRHPFWQVGEVELVCIDQNLSDITCYDYSVLYEEVAGHTLYQQLTSAACLAYLKVQREVTAIRNIPGQKCSHLLNGQQARSVSQITKQSLGSAIPLQPADQGCLFRINIVSPQKNTEARPSARSHRRL